VSIAERYSSAGIDKLDLVQKGNEGFILAVTSFRESSGKSFTTHAADCIEDAIAKTTAEAKSRSE
jgi:DNA-directed RNA polymerase specialized sigma subunit